ncbi:glucose dehydrogenase [FAD, quinone]-like [Belonocnema kinseyi]|uniref:glucose dehydrogenase [FAD, quinone]-like n=1 Tax=Belonocnema kinseyi TaxID=2817044 RepID=UPI00143D82EC|nr:glucose dehydrogenase [FAD, quinone]-like [Belonocnema kinseyi]
MILPSLLPFIPTWCAANYCACMATIFSSLMWVFWPEDIEFNKQTKIEPIYYDFIVVGAGSAGCVVANRLSEIKEWNVLLLEAGGEQPIVADIPGFVYQLGKTAIDWNYTTQAEAESCLINKGCNLPRGKVMGGSSSHNTMMYVRGNAEDYNNLARKGNTGWSYQEILPYFKKSEDNTDPEIVRQNPGYHGTKGYLTVSKYPFLSPAGRKVEEAFNELGYATKDINAKSQLGITNAQATIDNGVRESANAAFIRPIRGLRHNLIVKNKIYVTKILIDPVTRRAYGVECKSSPTGTPQYFLAKKEVIVSAGAINSPRLLMVSGVGPTEELSRNRIRVIQNLSVGRNFHDHFAAIGVSGIRKKVSLDNDVECKEKVGNFTYYAITQKGTFSAVGPAFLAAYVRTEFEKNMNIPDTQLNLIVSDENKFSIMTVLLTPNSRGYIKLNTTDPVWGSPLIYPGYLTAEPDLKRIIQGIRIGLSVFNTAAMKKYQFRLDDTPMPPCHMILFNSDAYWTCVVRYFGFPFHHIVGTCKMGPQEDAEAVVDPRLRVYGIQGLRVIDASVISVVPRGNTNAPVMMFAEKGSDMIKEDYLFREPCFFK